MLLISIRVSKYTVISILGSNYLYPCRCYFLILFGFFKNTNNDIPNNSFTLITEKYMFTRIMLLTTADSSLLTKYNRFCMRLGFLYIVATTGENVIAYGGRMLR